MEGGEERKNEQGRREREASRPVGSPNTVEPAKRSQVRTLQRKWMWREGEPRGGVR